MEEIKPKKERKFLKAMGDIALVLFRELVLGIGKKVINKVGNKRQGLAIAFVMVAGISYAAIDSIPYPITGNKQRLGWQTTGNGLVYRGTASDTVTKPSNYTNKDIKAYLLVDTVNNVMYSYIASKGGWQFNNSDTVIIQGATMPFDSITFNTAKDGIVGVGEVEYNDTQGSLIQGLKGGNVTNVIGQQLHQRVNNRTGAPLAKGDVVYLSGSQGNRITVAKALATSDPTSANTFGIVAESIADNQSGYIITEGLITGLNTSSLTQDSAVYLSGTTAGALTSTKPQAPIHGVYIGVCVESSNGNGKIFCKIRNGSELDELHDVQITSPVNKASLFYRSSDGLWHDTTAALLVSDTASMLTPYFRDADTTSLNLTSRFAAKLNISDTASMLTNYLRTGVAASTYLTQSNAASTYLPLTGGTLTGALNGTTGTFTGLNVNNTTTEGIFSLQGYDNNTATRIQFKTGNIVRQEIIKPTSASNLQFRSYPTGTAQGGYEFYVSNGSTESLAATIATDKSLSLTGSLGVTGQTTLSNLSGTGSRMVVAGSDGLLSTQALGVSTFSAGTTGFTPSTATSGAITLGGTLAIANGGTGATSAANARTNLGATTRGANTFLLTDIGAISFLRYNADNTVSQRAADGMRSDLGGTTIGQSMFTLTNPSAVTFPRFNADNTVSSLNATDFRTAIGAGTGNGNGTVTNVTGTLPISVANGTTTPSITIANASTTASGVVTTGTQSMAGNKTFTGDLATSGAFSATGFSTLTGGASIGTMATTSSLTHVLGVNSSNAIGEVTLGNLSISSGTLNVNVSDGIKTSSGTVALDVFRTITVGTDFPNTSAQSSSDITATVTGAVAGQPVWLGVPNSAVSANTSYTAWVSASNTVTIRFNNYSSASVNPSSGSFYVVVINL